MSPAPIESTLPGSLSSESSSLSGKKRQFANLRGVRWRINLGILPSSSSIDDIRRVTADSRRRYAGLRRRLLVEPHVPKDGSNCPDLVMDNPLSQNPDSMWGRFFRNAELEKMVDQDLSRLYPEHGRYFQTPGCQGMLRRILLLWCLRHPEYGYRQGMHELLAPLLFVLHVDVEHLSQVRKLYEDHFTDKFDDLSFHESDLTYNFDLKKFPDSLEDEIGCHGNAMKVGSLGEVDPEIQTIVLLSDAYGAEGELGIVLSEKFMEHDAYCMFDALMSGARGAVAMADFFSPSPIGGSHTGLPPVIEASSALYHLLSIVDSSLHSHLVELGVEPQYFALRWLRVLFGREFSLEDLLIIWDEIFASDNSKLNKGVEDDIDSSFAIFNSPRGAFISAMAVSMILNLRSSLLATENATTCLQRLLNFQESINLKKLIEKAKSLRTIALEANSSNPSPTTPLSLVPESYWEEKWRVLHKEEELKRGGERKKDPKSSVRRSLLEDLCRQLGSEEDIGEIVRNEVLDQKDPIHVEVEVEEQDANLNSFTCPADDSHLIGNTGSEENSSIFSASTSPLTNDHENDSEKSSIVSNSSLDENDDEPNNAEAFRIIPEDPLPVSDPPEDISPKPETNNDSTGKQEAGLKERKLLSGKFQWFWKFGRNAAGEETSEKEGASEAAKSANRESNQGDTSGASTSDEFSNSSVNSKGDAADQIMMSTLKNLGQSMLENIQVIESVFQQDRGQGGSLENFSKNVIVGKGQVTAMAALKELRKISNLLSEM
ncbi:TBC1 domain family member 5 [Vitis vinifera]|uniref:TBC1 domain family member 5 n=1 Tax=Vitis vinifera TaxID=29760 RepID=A0A438JFV8_VITVI|nr:TBC1 domain family member 5 [Vitis vinifera]